MEGVAPRPGCMIRTIYDALMEPGRSVPPPKQRKRRSKRTEGLKTQGKIEKYLININIPKELCATPKVEGADGGDGGGGGARAQKRKGAVWLEDLTADRRSKKSLKLMVDDYDDACVDTNSRTTSPVHLGDKIRGMGGADQKTKLVQRGWAGFKTVTEKEGGDALLGLDGKTRDFI